MIVEWKKNRLKIIPITKGCIEARKVYKKRNIVLLPGHNEIPDEVWNDLLTYSSIQNSIKSKHLLEVHKEKKIEIEVEEEDKNGKKVKKKKKTTVMAAKKFKELSSEEAREIIADTFNVESLEKWRKDEKKADIRNLIDDRIKELKQKNIDDRLGKED